MDGRGFGFVCCCSSAVSLGCGDIRVDFRGAGAVRRMRSSAWIVREVSMITVPTTALPLHKPCVSLMHAAEEDPVMNVFSPLHATKSSITKSKSSSSLKLKSPLPTSNPPALPTFWTASPPVVICNYRLPQINPNCGRNRNHRQSHSHSHSHRWVHEDDAKPVSL